MSVITVFFHLFNRREGIQSLSLSAESLGTDNIQSLKRIQKRLLLGSLFFESVGALRALGASMCIVPEHVAAMNLSKVQKLK